MRASISLILAASRLLSAGAALPQHESLALKEGLRSHEDVAPAQDIESRVAPTEADDKPKYSTVPLFPDEDDEEDGDGSSPGDGSDGGEDGNQGDDDGDGVVTLIQTVTDDPVTKILTKTVPDDETQTVTKALPTTKTVVSVIDMDGEVTTTVYVTQTPEPLPPPPAPEPTTVVITEEPEVPTETSTPSPSSTASTPTWRPTVILPDPTSIVQPTTFATLTRSSSSSTQDDGQWPVTKTYDNGQWHTIYPPWNATDSSRWRRIR